MYEFCQAGRRRGGEFLALLGDAGRDAGDGEGPRHKGRRESSWWPKNR